MTFSEFALFSCIGIFLYNYFVYPLIMITYAKFATDLHHNNVAILDSELPKVSFIIAAYNEEKVIENKISNTLNINYPKELIEIIVVSDGSNDTTPLIVGSFEDQGVIGLHHSDRSGKSAALNRAVEISNGSIIVFSDANNDFSIDSVRQLVRHFSDSQVGAVSGSKQVYSSDSRESAKGDGLYWKYESAIKSAESKIGSITAAEGEIFAVRKVLFDPIDPALINDDAAITFCIVKKGYRVLYEVDAVAYEQASIDLLDDINVKIRMTAGGFQTLMKEKSFLLPPRSWFAFTFLSHKLLRWIAPHLMVLIILFSFLSIENQVAKILLILQGMFYSISLYGWIARRNPLPGWVYIPMYFTVMNVALMLGFFRFLNKKQSVSWKKAER